MPLFATGGGRPGRRHRIWSSDLDQWRRRDGAEPFSPPMALDFPYAITGDPIDLGALIERVRSDACGAVVTFIGVVRAVSDDGRPVEGLTYEAYPALALPEMRAIGAEASQRFGGVRVAIVHRVGALALGEVSVAIVVAAAHRGVAFDACEHAIDELKRRLPVWKKEHYVGGGARWRDNVVPDA
jgi:molybdopterin synthase catalytic subunit